MSSWRRSWLLSWRRKSRRGRPGGRHADGGEASAAGAGASAARPRAQAVASAAVSDAEVSFDVVAPANAAGEARQSKPGDEKIFTFGRFLRRRSLDEFPQFCNVLVGGMSVAEPRRYTPEPNGAFRRRTRGYRSRQLVTPGITGLAQSLGYRGWEFLIKNCCCGGFTGTSATSRIGRCGWTCKSPCKPFGRYFGRRGRLIQAEAVRTAGTPQNVFS